VSAYIPGCAARPEAIIDGIVKLLGSLEDGAPAKTAPAAAADAAPERKEAAHG
jgi:NADH:ubiquinone oxidoreductase subunit B-like Fe-S oxidoreductase